MSCPSILPRALNLRLADSRAGHHQSEEEEEAEEEEEEDWR